MRISSSNGRAAISVVVPYYNGEDWIARSLSSILSQTLLPSEVLVIDDGSKSPLTREDIKDIMEMEAVRRRAVNLKIIRHAVNRGIPAARNTGIKASSGEWIAFLDQDDEWDSKKLERQMYVLGRDSDKKRQCRGIFSAVLEKNAFTTLERSSPKKEEIGMIGRKGVFRSLLWYGNFVYWITMMVHKECFEKIGYLDESLAGGSDDYDFALRLSLEGHLLFDAGSPIAIHYVHGNNYSHALKFAEDNKKIYAKYKNLNSALDRLLKKALSRNYYMEARYWHLQGKYQIAKKIYLNSIASCLTLKSIVMFCICFSKGLFGRSG